MTERQLRILDIVRDHIETHGFAPTYEELAEMIGLLSKGRVHLLVNQLLDRGHLIRTGGRDRAIALPDMIDLRSVPTRVLAAELERRSHG